MGEATGPEKRLAGGLRDHALRAELAGEVHARPFAQLQAPLRGSHIAMLSGETNAETDRGRVADLCARTGVPPPAADATHVMVDLGPFRLKWERHTEFSTYSFFRDDGDAGVAERELFADPVIGLVPRDWLESLPGDLMVGLHVRVLQLGAQAPGPANLPAGMQGEHLAGSRMSGGRGSAWVDFQLGADGFGRVLLYDHGLRPRQAGRLVQRLLEIETYRMMALLALPLARRHGPDLSRAERGLTEITRRLTEIGALEEQRQLLDELTELAASIEGISAATNYRFAAARAYYTLVQRRIVELREERIEGYQTIGEFMERRMAPAMRTCEAVGQRIETLSGRLTRASQLLRARIEIQMEAQNRNLLASMNRRARLQLRLQETVEGLSVAAICYYVASLVGYLAKGAKVGGVAVNPDVAVAVSIPVIAVLVWVGIRRLRRRLAHAAENEES